MKVFDTIVEERAKRLNSGRVPLHIHLGHQAWRELARYLSGIAPCIDPHKTPGPGEVRLFDIPLTVHRDGRPADYVAIVSRHECEA